MSWGEAQRPALFYAEARRTGGKKAIGTRKMIRFPVKKFSRVFWACSQTHICVCVCVWCGTLRTNSCSAKQLGLPRIEGESAAPLSLSPSGKSKMWNLSCKSISAGVGRVNEDVKESLAVWADWLASRDNKPYCLTWSVPLPGSSTFKLLSSFPWFHSWGRKLNPNAPLHKSGFTAFWNALLFDVYPSKSSLSDNHE